MRIITTVCWLITGLALTGAAVWFLTGTVYGYRPDKGGFDWDFGINIGSMERLTGFYEARGTYNPGIAGVDSININWIAGEVTVKPYDGADFKITEFAQRALYDNEKLQIDVSGGTLAIKFCENGRILRMPQKKLEVLIPRELSGNLNMLTIDSTSGGVYTEEIGAEALKINTMSGRIQLSNATARSQDIDSTSGSIIITQVQADSMRINSMSGSIHVADAAIRSIDVDSTSGSINVFGSFDSANLQSMSGRIVHNNSAQRSVLDADSTSGSLELSGSFDRVNANSMSGGVTIKSATIPSSLKVDTTSGSIIVSVPDEGTITVNHSSVSGRFSSDIPVTIQNSGAQFELSSMSGSIRITKLS